MEIGKGFGDFVDSLRKTPNIVGWCHDQLGFPKRHGLWCQLIHEGKSVDLVLFDAACRQFWSGRCQGKMIGRPPQGRTASITDTHGKIYSGEETFIHIFVSECARIASPTLLYYCKDKKILKIDGAREVNASIDFGYENKFTLQKWIE